MSSVTDFPLFTSTVCFQMNLIFASTFAGVRNTVKHMIPNAKIKKVKKTKNSAAVKLEYNKYYFRLRFIGKNGVSKWSKVKEVKVK